MIKSSNTGRKYLTSSKKQEELADRKKRNSKRLREIYKKAQFKQIRLVKPLVPTQFVINNKTKCSKNSSFCHWTSEAKNKADKQNQKHHTRLSCEMSKVWKIKRQSKAECVWFILFIVLQSLKYRKGSSFAQLWPDPFPGSSFRKEIWHLVKKHWIIWQNETSLHHHWTTWFYNNTSVAYIELLVSEFPLMAHCK